MRATVQARKLRVHTRDIHRIRQIRPQFWLPGEDVTLQLPKNANGFLDVVFAVLVIPPSADSVTSAADPAQSSRWDKCSPDEAVRRRCQGMLDLDRTAQLLQ